MQLRRINNAVHRDLGYLLAGTTILYAISGLALNHVNDWNPNFIIERQEIRAAVPPDAAAVTRDWVLDVLTPLGERNCYRSHDFPVEGKVKIYLDEGSIFVDWKAGTGIYESVRRRPLFYQMNRLHVVPRRAWLLFSDFVAAGLIVVSVTGLFVLKGRKGITGRGLIFAGVGFLIPFVFLFIVEY